MGFDSPIEKVPSLDSTREQKIRGFLRFEINFLPDLFKLDRVTGGTRRVWTRNPVFRAVIL